MNDAETRIRADLRDAVEEHSAVPSSCPWCEYSRWDPRHITKAHPEKWAEWKEEHEQVTITKSIWVGAETE
jgi:queuine/archaeosine tRNA-ribosyltransferase